jgi:hypothetical protein
MAENYSTIKAYRYSATFIPSRFVLEIPEIWPSNCPDKMVAAK